MGKSLHISLAILLYISSAGVLVHKHLCQGKVINVAFWSPANSCHEEDEATCSSSANSCTIPSGEKSEKECCDDDLSFEVADWDYVPDNHQKINFDQHFSACLPNPVFVISQDLRENPSDRNYRPPPLKLVPLPILYCSFRC
ncbi:MAG: hypothetical protein EA411_09000 [Saprospirales bacterium]|nr:MAG: hypothetical protein EA411_09000 [Saprospirales bacterium]